MFVVYPSVIPGVERKQHKYMYVCVSSHSRVQGADSDNSRLSELHWLLVEVKLAGLGHDPTSERT
jgi:hypothetical protein